MIYPNGLKTRTSISDGGQEQLVVLLERASLIGPSTIKYIKSIIETGRMERRIIDGCKAILTLEIAYSAERLEAACKRGLAGTKFNHSAILNILQNKQDQVPQKPPSLAGGKTGNTETLDSLRGATFFNIPTNNADE